MTTKTFNVQCDIQTPLAKRAVEALAKVVRVRTGLEVRCNGIPAVDPAVVPDIRLGIRADIGTEGYEIADCPSGGVAITGGCERGVLYGIGRFLHEARYEAGRVTPGAWRGVSRPACSLRGMYLAFHQNAYSFASIEELTDYMESLALWGVNTVAFHFWNPTDTTSPEAKAVVARHRSILMAAKALGMRVALLDSPNCGDVDAPPEAYAPAFPDTDPERRGTSGIRVCPSHPAGFAYLSKRMDRYVAGYEDIGIDYIVAFPYDSGGCGCPDCWPWGAKGFLTLSKEWVRVARLRYPDIKFILGTWCYDVCETPDGEWEGLAKELADKNGWVDYIMADSHFEFPEYPLKHGVPGNLPMINFAEISMWGRFPWGAFGANPLPERFQRIWDETDGKLDGGLPYSEGMFEDINKIIFANFFWDKAAKASDAVRAYIAYEYGHQVVDIVYEAIRLLEKTYPRTEWERADVEKAYALILQADALLDERAKTSWRWRILYLRAVVDYELARNANEPTDRCDAAYEEMIAIFHLEDGWRCVTPQSRAYLARLAEQERLQATKAPPGHETAASTPFVPGSDQGAAKRLDNV
ncbi:MAG: glycoside hydrolase family 20 zincin-like fold domain-containing protein [Kiritimatiellaeota bacterium]|nr:glycoside hydrolase family 20 zincin-like fold domain-containing protein [Kiritimatiellota bacterium]